MGAEAGEVPGLLIEFLGAFGVLSAAWSLLMDLDQVPYFQVLLGSCLDLDLVPFLAFQVLQEACFDFQEAS